MGRNHILRLFAGFRRFRERMFLREDSVYQRLSTGQAPKTLIIACSDSRVDPAIMTSASPGEIFVIRNVANLVPPFESANSGFHGVSAAIEFAVVNLKVENVLIMGHRQCGGIAALMSDSPGTGEFVRKWVGIAAEAKARVLSQYATSDFDMQCRHCERESIVTSLQNLKTFPFVQAAISEREMHVLGIYFDLESGELFEYDHELDAFRVVGQKEVDAAEAASTQE